MSLYDSDLAKIFPEWGSYSKSEQDKVWNEYQEFSFSPKNKRQFDEYDKEADVLDRERFIKLVPIHLDNKNFMALMPLLERSWENEDEECHKDLSKELWDTAGSSIVNALDVRDHMFHLQLLDIIKAICMYNGRALRVLRKSKKFVPWIKFCLTDKLNGQANFLSAPPIRYSVMILLKYVIVGCKKKFLDELMESNVITMIFSKIRNCCPSLIPALGETIEELIKATDTHYSQEAFKENQRLSVTFQVGNQQVCNRVLEFDFTKERFRDHGKMGTWTDVGKIAGGFANVLLAMQAFLRIPTPLPARQHLAVFGKKYSDMEPRDPVERNRWSNRYFCLRVGQVDFSSDQGQVQSQEIKMTVTMRGQIVDQNRATSIQCGMCRKIEPEEEEGERLFSKCGRCRLVLYCSRECQTKHWKTHKKVCSKPAKESLPEPLLNLNESVSRSHSKLEGKVMYPSIFGVWLFHKKAS